MDPVLEAQVGDFSVGYPDIALNLTLLFGLVPGKHESIVWAGWSIGIEILFYIVFPLMALLLTSRASAVVACCVSAVISSMEYRALLGLNVGSYAYMNLITQLPFFISGILAYLVLERRWFHPEAPLGARHALWHPVRRRGGRVSANRSYRSTLHSWGSGRPVNVPTGLRSSPR